MIRSWAILRWFNRFHIFSYFSYLLNGGGAGGEWGEENIVSLLKKTSLPSPSLICKIYSPRISEPKSPLYGVSGVNKFLRKVMIFLRKKGVNSVRPINILLV